MHQAKAGERTSQEHRGRPAIWNLTTRAAEDLNMRDIRQLTAIVLWRVNDKQIIRVAHNAFVSAHGVEISATAAKDFESADHVASAREVERNTYCISRCIGKRNSTAARQVESTRDVASLLISVPAEAGGRIRMTEVILEKR